MSSFWEFSFIIDAFLHCPGENWSLLSNFLCKLMLFQKFRQPLSCFQWSLLRCCFAFLLDQNALHPKLHNWFCSWVYTSHPSYVVFHVFRTLNAKSSQFCGCSISQNCPCDVQNFCPGKCKKCTPACATSLRMAITFCREGNFWRNVTIAQWNSSQVS